jgi:hypothetical protein
MDIKLLVIKIRYKIKASSKKSKDFIAKNEVKKLKNANT